MPALELERQAVDRLHHAVVGREVHAQVAHVEEARLVDAGHFAGETPLGSGGFVDGSCEPHPRVDHGVQEVHDQVRQHDEDAAQQHDAEHLGQVVVGDRVDRVLADARAARTCSR